MLHIRRRKLKRKDDGFLVITRKLKYVFALLLRNLGARGREMEEKEKMPKRKINASRGPSLASCIYLRMRFSPEGEACAFFFLPSFAQRDIRILTGLIVKVKSARNLQIQIIFVTTFIFSIEYRTIHYFINQMSNRNFFFFKFKVLV